MEEFEQKWKHRAEKKEKESELHDMEWCHSYFCNLIEPREVVELKELQKRFRAAYHYPAGKLLANAANRNSRWRAVSASNAY